MVERVKIFVTSTVIMQHWFVVFILSAHIKENVGDAGARPLAMRVWLTPQHAMPYICYHTTKFGYSRSNRLGVGRGLK